MRKYSIYICLAALLATTVMISDVLAETYNIKEMTPQVQKALEQRRNRYDKLTALKDKGYIGENNRGYVQAFKDDPEVAYIVQDENSNRLTIYQTIAEQNDLMKAIYTIEQVFARVQRDKASAGHKIQTESGEWVVKK